MTIVKEITIGAPVQRVFSALTNPQQLPQWWGEEGKFRVDRMECDLRAGGHWLNDGTFADGRPFTVKGVYHHVRPPRFLEMTVEHWGERAWQTIVRYELTESGGKTRLLLTHSGFTDEAFCDAHSREWDYILARLGAFVEARSS